VQEIASVDPALVKGYIEGKPAYGQVFPGIYYAVGKRVEDRLTEAYPQLEAVVGPDDKQALMAKFPEKGEDVPLDWVAFGYYGIDMYHFHVGILVDVDRWPVTWVVGVHVMDRYLSDEEMDIVLPRLQEVEWAEAVGREPDYVYAESVCEHRWLDPVRELDFARVEQEVATIVDRACKYYEASAPAAALLAEARS
jgi:hypothetical protein